MYVQQIRNNKEKYIANLQLPKFECIEQRMYITNK